MLFGLPRYLRGSSLRGSCLRRLSTNAFMQWMSQSTRGEERLQGAELATKGTGASALFPYETDRPNDRPIIAQIAAKLFSPGTKRASITRSRPLFLSPNPRFRFDCS